MKVGIYVRVSTQEQSQEGFSIPAQRERLLAFCQSQGWDVVEEYIEEGWSAKTIDRPQMQRMLSDVEEGKIELLLVYRLDRLTRSVLDLYTLLQTFEKHKVSFRSATEVYDTSTAMGRLFITLVAALAQWERENLGERVKFGMEQMVNQGKRPGAPAPYGYQRDDDGNLHIDEKEANTVRQVFDWFVSGHGLETILSRLHEQNTPSPSGNKGWHINYVRYMLRNPVYIGKIRWGDAIGQGSHEPIIDEVTFKRAQEIIEERKTAPPSENVGRYPLTGVLRCGKCGSKMSGKIFNRNKKYETVYYRCLGKVNQGICDMQYVRQDYIETALVEYVEYIMNDKEEFKKQLDAQAIPVESPEKDMIKRYKRELEDITKQKQRWYDLFNDPNNPIPKEDLFSQIRLLNEKEKEVHNHLKKLEGTTEKEKPSVIEYADRYKDFKKLWYKYTPEERKRLIHDLFEYVIIYPDQRIEYKFK